MHKKTKGEIAEMFVAARLMKAGFRVLFPVGENNRYDLVAERNNKFVRIQVKYADPRQGALRVSCRSSNNWSVLHYSEDEIDMIAAYNPRDDSVYFISVKDINRTLITLRLEPTKNNQKAKINFAENYKDINF